MRVRMLNNSSDWKCVVLKLQIRDILFGNRFTHSNEIFQLQCHYAVWSELKWPTSILNCTKLYESFFAGKRMNLLINIFAGNPCKLFEFYIPVKFQALFHFVRSIMKWISSWFLTAKNLYFLWKHTSFLEQVFSGEYLKPIDMNIFNDF